MSQRRKYCLLGIGDHQGVLNVGGRVGAASGPSAFRRYFSKLNGRSAIVAGLEDRGDVGNLGSDVTVNHRLAAEAVEAAHRAADVSVVVGGGHDHGYSQLWGVSRAAGGQQRTRKASKTRLGCINIDAHLDVRKPDPLPSSGSPFYLAVEAGVLDPARFVEFGIQDHCNGTALWEYVGRKKIGVLPFAQLRGGRAVKAFAQALKKLESKCDSIVLSLDLDAAAQAYAPGVSAPQAEGFTGSEIIEMCEIAGRSKKVVSLGIFELNPEHDIDGRTARLAATAAWHFLDCVLGRGPAKGKK